MLFFFLRQLDWVGFETLAAFGLWLLTASPATGEFQLSDQESEVYYRFAIVAGDEVKVDKDGEVVGHLHSNGDVVLKSDSSVVGDVSAVGDIDVDGSVSGTVTEGMAFLDLPMLLDEEALRALADRIFEHDTTFSDEVIDDVIFIDGKVRIEGALNGLGTIIATQEIRFTADSDSDDDDSDSDSGGGSDSDSDSGSDRDGGSDSDSDSDGGSDSDSDSAGGSDSDSDSDGGSDSDSGGGSDSDSDSGRHEIFLDPGTRLSLISLGDIRLDMGRPFRGVLRASRDIALDKGSVLEGVLVADRKVRVKKDAIISFLDFDRVAPRIDLLLPDDGAFLSDASPQILAEMSDEDSGLNLASVELLIDGEDRTQEADLEPSRLSFVPSEPLSEGPHAVEIAISDVSDNERRLGFSFTVDSVAPELVIERPEEAEIIDEATFEVVTTYLDAVTGVDLESFQVTIDASDLSAACAIGEVSAVCPSQELEAGAHMVTAMIRDLAGNVATTSRNVVIVLDAEPPVISVSSPVAGALFNTPLIPVIGAVADDSRVDNVKINGRPVVLSDTMFSNGILVGEGESSIVVEATDAWGNHSSVSIMVVVDTTPPQLELLGPAPELVTNLRSVPVSGKVSDEVGVARVEINGVPAVLNGDAFQETMVLVDGDNEFTIEAFDTAGNSRRLEVGVQRFGIPEVSIVEPVNQDVVVTETIDVLGAVSNGVSAVEVNGIVATLDGTSFFLPAMSVHEGANLITAVASDTAGRMGLTTVTVVRDQTPPRLTIDYPQDGAVLYDSSIAVRGTVNDLVAGPNVDEPEVTVNGIPATVLNGAFIARAVPLQLGDNLLVVEALDGSGNLREAERQVHLAPSTGPRIVAISGGDQSAPIGSSLPEPMVVQLRDASGQPVSGHTVVFKLRGNNGSLGNGARRVAVQTSADGLAQASFSLGTRAGAGTQVVEASAVGFSGSAVFIADAMHGEADSVVIDSGMGQVGIAGNLLPEPLVAVVIDDGGNRLQATSVEFEVVAGGGVLSNGEATSIVETDRLGRAIETLLLGPEEGSANNVVRTRLLGDSLAGYASFVASARIAGDPADTEIVGVVLDNTDQPVPGATVTLAGTALSAQTDSTGVFRLASAPVGTVDLIVDAATTSRTGVWPHLEFRMVTLPGHENRLDRPIYVLPIDVESGLVVSESEGGVLTLDEVPGFALEIAPGSVTFPDGSSSGTVSVTVVHPDRVPMMPNFGQQPRFIVTIQPVNATFDPPAKITLPNTDSLAPGQVIEIYSFDHDLGRFTSIGNGTVSDDGRVISSNPGVGILKAGWHCGGNPSPSTGTPHDCPECQLCTGDGCGVDELQNGETCGEPPNKAQDDCVIRRFCDSGSCIEEDVEVYSIDGPCIAEVGKRVSFTADSNDPSRVQWMSPGGEPPLRTGESHSPVYFELGNKTVTAACSNSVSVDVYVARSCDSVVPTHHEDIQVEIIPASDFGQVIPLLYEAGFRGCSTGGEYCYRLADFTVTYSYGINSQEKIDVDDVEITPENCAEIIADLTPPPAGSDFGPPRRRYWSEELVRKHEDFHVADVRRQISEKTFDQLRSFVEKQANCNQCFGPPDEDLFRDKALEFWEANRKAFDDGKEVRAYDHVREDYLSLVRGIECE